VTLAKQSPCKINLLLNILGRRPDGFHDLETVMQPVALCDELTFERTAAGIHLTCSEPSLPTDSSNLVCRAAGEFFEAAAIASGVSIHLEKRIPMAAGLGGGSGNAATTLLALNEMFDSPLAMERTGPTSGRDRAGRRRRR
jgi:4-diphosphocytidyl-2-C-methyl-D-erythritol kinase